MAWHLTVINNYHEAVKAVNTVVNSHEAKPTKINQRLGSGHIDIGGLGSVSFIDVGDRDIGGHSKATRGVLISYQGEEVVFRYEGEGEIQVTINEPGQAELKGNGEFSKIKLESFVLHR